MKRLVLILALLVFVCRAEAQVRIPGPGGFIPSSGGTLTFAHKWESSGCTGTGTTCTVTTSANIATGDVLAWQTETTNAVKISSVSGGGACQDAFVRTGRTNFFQTECYVLSATAFSTGTITVTFNATPGASHVILWHYTQTGTGLGLDSTSEWSTGDAGTSAVQVPFVLSGTNGVAIEQASASTNPTHCTGISATGWTQSTAPNDETGGCSAQASGLSSNPTTPTVSYTANNEGTVSGLLLSFNPTSAVQYGITDFAGSVNGTHPAADTQAKLNAGVHGITGINQENNGVLQIGVTDNNNALTYSTSAYKAFTTLPRFLNSGVTYTTPTTQLGMSWSSTTASGQVAKIAYTFPGTNFMGDKSFAASEWMQFQGFAVTDTLNADILTSNATGGSQTTVNLSADGSHVRLTLESEANCTNTGPAAIFIENNQNVWLEIEILYSPGVKEELIVYDASHTALGTITRTPNGTCTLAGTPTGFTIGEALGGANTAGRTILFGPLKWGYIGNFTTEIVL